MANFFLAFLASTNVKKKTRWRIQGTVVLVTMRVLRFGLKASD